MIQTTALSFSYGEDTTFQFPSINVDPGESLLIIGQSGVGKTTLLHLLAGLLKSDNGAIEIEGTDLSQLSQKQLDIFRGKQIGVIFQQHHLIKALNVKQNIVAASYFANKKEDSNEVDTLIKQLGLSHRIHQKPASLSIGERQRVSIARALINQPKLILADEPTSSLDDQNASNVIQLLKEQASKQKAALIIVTHDQRLKDQFQNIVEL